VEGYSFGLLDSDYYAGHILEQLLPHMNPAYRLEWHTQNGLAAISRCLDDDSVPDLLLLDVDLPEAQAFKVCTSVRAESVLPPILGLTSFPVINSAEKLAEAGAQGIILKSDFRQLSAGICHVLKGTTFSPVCASSYKSCFTCYQRMKNGLKNRTIRLSHREISIMEELCDGKTITEIAELDGIELATVRSHTRNIRAKLGARTMNHAIRIWLTDFALRRSVALSK